MAIPIDLHGATDLESIVLARLVAKRADIGAQKNNGADNVRGGAESDRVNLEPTRGAPPGATDGYEKVSTCTWSTWSR